MNGRNKQLKNKTILSFLPTTQWKKIWLLKRIKLLHWDKINSKGIIGFQFPQRTRTRSLGHGTVVDSMSSARVVNTLQIRWEYDAPGHPLGNKRGEGRSLTKATASLFVVENWSDLFPFGPDGVFSPSPSTEFPHTSRCVKILTFETPLTLF